MMKKTIRLLYPDHVSGGLTTYYFGAHLMRAILPANEAQPWFTVDVDAPNDEALELEEGIYGLHKIQKGMDSASDILKAQKPDRIITVGGNCIVSQVPFDYLHKRYKNTGILWIDAHPDVSDGKDGYPYAHAMVLRNLLGKGSSPLAKRVEAPFDAKDILYVGLQGLHTYQKAFLEETKVSYQIQDQQFISLQQIQSFVQSFDHILVHLDIDVLDPGRFHSTYFANPALTGDGSGGGKMTLDELHNILQCIDQYGDIVGFSIAEYLPFDEEKLFHMFQSIKMFNI